jgi:uncharacterized membrane protein YeaQ/YmgE (transglycosylase-associated protein family)
MVPSEVTLGGVYLPPLVLTIALGLVGAWVAAKILNRTGLSRFFWQPPLAFAALWVLATGLIGLLAIAP